VAARFSPLQGAKNQMVGFVFFNIKFGWPPNSPYCLGEIIIIINKTLDYNRPDGHQVGFFFAWRPGGHKVVFFLLGELVTIRSV